MFEGGGPPRNFEVRKFPLSSEIYVDSEKTVAARLDALRHQVMSHSFVMVSLRMPQKEDQIRAEYQLALPP